MQITDFTFTKLAITTIGKRLFRFEDDCNIFVNAPAGKGWKFTLKRGFVTDLGSVPDFLSGLIPQYGDQDLTVSYCVHDALYTRIGATPETARHLTTKEFADDLLKAMLADCDKNTNAQIKELELINKIAGLSKESIETNRQSIKLLEDQILGNKKIWLIWKAVSWFGNGAFNEPLKPPYDKNNDKFLMEVL
jgi:hypothetical protein